jgi:cytochrome P450
VGRDKVHYLASAPEYARRVLSDPETFHTVGLVARGPRHSAQRRLRRGIVSMNGPAHRHYRRLLAPPLRKAAVEAHAPGIAAAVASELDAWPVGQEADLFALCRGLLRRIAAYYRTMAVRLHAFGGGAVAARSVWVIEAEAPRAGQGRYPRVVAERRFGTPDEAEAWLRAHPSPRARLVSKDLLESCVPLSALAGFEPVHRSAAMERHASGVQTPLLQIFRYRPPGG